MAGSCQGKDMELVSFGSRTKIVIMTPRPTTGQQATTAHTMPTPKIPMRDACHCKAAADEAYLKSSRAHTAAAADRKKTLGTREPVPARNNPPP